MLGWLAAIAATIVPVAAPAAAQTKPPLTVFAAASLTNALNEIGKAYTAKTGQAVRFSFASSGVIAKQIEAGAKADLFFSADTDWMDYVQTRGLIDPVQPARPPARPARADRAHGEQRAVEDQARLPDRRCARADGSAVDG